MSDFAEQMDVNFFGAVAMTKGEQPVHFLWSTQILEMISAMLLVLDLAGKRVSNKCGDLAATLKSLHAGFQDALLATARRGQSKPVIVNVNSFGGRIPLRNMAAYSASKFALAGETTLNPDPLGYMCFLAT